MQDGAILSTSQTVSHEMGHCLGLVHTRGLGPGNCEDDGSNCERLGDFVCDTPPDPGGYDINNQSCLPSTLPVTDYLNIMSEFHPHTCRDHFTLGQGQRMRRYLNENIGKVAMVRLQDVVISGHTQWLTAMTAPANIIIEPGGQLDIHAPLTMHANAYIYVKTSTAGQLGGRLNVYSLITADCDNMWEGILVDGRQSPGQQVQSQGKAAIFEGGIIEHARCGIRAQGRDQSGAWQPFATGGIVTSFEGVFRDNVVGVHLPPNFLKNQSYLYFTQFKTTDAFRGGSPSAPRHVFLDGVSTVKVFGCSFSDLRTTAYTLPASRYTGIVANNAGFHVRPLGADAASFNGLFEGIRISQISEFGGNHIFGTHFNACFTGIRSYNNNNYTFIGNTFSMQRPANFTGPFNTAFTGIDMQGGSTAFQVSGNQFENVETNVDDLLVGTKAIAVTKDNRSIAGNTYFNMHKGNVANGQNGITVSELMFSGLMYECNDFVQDFDHDNIVESGIVRKEQGARNLNSSNSDRISTGNTYDLINEQQFTNFGSQPTDYHHRVGTPEELLTGHFNVGGVTPRQGIPNTNCGTNPECPNPPCAEAKLSNIKTQFFQNKQLWGAKVGAFPAITNPALQASEAIAINALRHELDMAGNAVILHYALDTAEVQTDSVLAWAAQLQTYNSDLQLAKYHFFKANFAAADTLLQHIPLQYSLSADLQAEFNDVKAVLQTIRPNVQAGGPLSELPPTTADSLQINWGTDCTAAGALARDLLYQNGRLLEANCGGSAQRPAAAFSQTLSRLDAARVLKIYPNPASTSLTVERASDEGILSLRVSDMSQAKVLMERHIYEGEKAVIFDISQLVPGIYLVSYQSSAAHGHVKLVVSN